MANREESSIEEAPAQDAELNGELTKRRAQLNTFWATFFSTDDPNREAV